MINDIHLHFFLLAMALASTAAGCFLMLAFLLALNSRQAEGAHIEKNAG
jgi:hypothetical protein